jgi:hypothetical protein
MVIWRVFLGPLGITDANTALGVSVPCLMSGTRSDMRFHEKQPVSVTTNRYGPTRTVAPHTAQSMGAAEIWQKFVWTVHSRRLFAAVGLQVLFAAQVAQAQSTGLPTHQALTQPPIQHSPTYCKQSTLTNVKFMQLIQALIAHGDLTDIAFIEKMLGTKFSSNYGTKLDGTPEHQTIILNSDQMLGGPIHVELIINYELSKQSKTGIIAALAIGQQSNFFADCLQINESYLSSYFGGNFLGKPPGPGIPTASVDQMNGRTGHNGSQIYLSFTYNLSGGLVTSFGISESP